MERSKRQHYTNPVGYYSYGIDDKIVALVLHMVAHGIDQRVIASHFGITLEDVQMILSEHLLS